MNDQLQLEAVRTANREHHRVFRHFQRWQGKVPEGHIVNFLGVLTRVDYFDLIIPIEKGYPADRYVKTEYPSFDEEYFEWIDLLEAVLAADGHFTMIELGAGWGRWIVNAAAALQQSSRLPYTLVGLEAEPTHFQMMVQHVATNGLDPKNFRLVEAAAAGADGKVGFEVGETPRGGPTKCYGHHMGGSHLVQAICLRTLLQPFPTVDLIDLDVQAAEFDVLEPAAEVLDRKVKRIHIGTHGRHIEDALRSLFGRLGWRCLNRFPCGASVETEWGPISFQDGVQTWLNPTFFNPSGTEVAGLSEKLELCRQECTRLRMELEKSSRLGVLIAPEGTRRRKIVDFFTKRF